MSRAIAVHVRYKSLSEISFPSSSKQEREVTKFYVAWGKTTNDGGYIFRISHDLQLNTVIFSLSTVLEPLAN